MASEIRKEVSKGSIRLLMTNASDVDGFRPFVVQVVQVLRYEVDALFRAATRQEAGTERGESAYDLILSDGRFQAKVLLAQTERSAVQQGLVREGTLVRVTSCRRLFDEADPMAVGFVVVTGLEVLHDAAQYPPYLRYGVKALEWIESQAPDEDPSTKEHFLPHIPLVGGRRTYFDVLSCDDPPSDDPRWASHGLFMKQEEAEEMAQQIVSIDQAVRAFRHTMDPKPIAGRIRRKGHLKITKSDSSGWPCQAYMELEDTSGKVVVVFWLGTCRDYFKSLHLNDLVCIDNYRMKAATAFSLQFSDAKVEVAINTGDLNHPRRQDTRSIIKTFHPNHWQLVETAPHPFQNFCTQEEVMSLTDGHICDVVGMVVFVGRPERELHRARGQRYYHRWVEVVDASQTLLVLQLYSCSQREELDRIRIGMVLTCSDMEVRSCIRGSHDRRWLHMVTTKSSQILSWYHDPKINPLERPFWDVDAVTQLCEWTHSKQGYQHAKMGLQGGFRYWPFPPTASRASSFKDVFPFIQDQLAPMSRIGEWSKALHLYERQVAVVQGTITQLLFWDGQSDLRPQPVTLEADESTRASKKKKKRRTQKGAAAVDEAVDFIDPYDEDDSFVFGEMVVLDNCVQEGVLPSSPNAFLPMNALGDPVCQNGWWQLTIAGLNKTDFADVLLGPPESYIGGFDEEFVVYSLAELFRLSPSSAKRASIRQQVLNMASQIAGKRFVFAVSMYRGDNGVELVLTHVFPNEE